MLKIRHALSVLAAVLVPVSLQAQDPYEMRDQSWISLDGTVESVVRDAFTLDYGDGLVTVEMDDWDYDADAYKVVVGDNVTVYGLIDDDLFETTTIEASSVYVEGLNSYFYASAADEEDTFVTMERTLDPASTIVQGSVVSVLEDHFTLSTGDGLLTVDVSGMAYDPLDDEGFQRIKVGDRVSVRGHIDASFFEARELDAESVITLQSEAT